MAKIPSIISGDYATSAKIIGYTPSGQAVYSSIGEGGNYLKGADGNYTRYLDRVIQVSGSGPGSQGVSNPSGGGGQSNPIIGTPATQAPGAAPQTIAPAESIYSAPTPVGGKDTVIGGTTPISPPPLPPVAVSPPPPPSIVPDTTIGLNTADATIKPAYAPTLADSSVLFAGLSRNPNRNPALSTNFLGKKTGRQVNLIGG